MFMVEDNVDDMDNWMEETMEFGDIMCINSVRMFFIKGGVVISFADVWYIKVFDRFNVCDDTKIHNIIKVEKDASKEEKKTNYILTEIIHHDVTDIHGLLLLVVLAIHSVLTTNTHNLIVVTHVEIIKTFYVNHNNHSISHPK